MPEAPGSLAALRRDNRRRVLDALRRRGSASRAELARATGLSRTTVSSVVAALIEEGVVVEHGDPPARAPTRNGGRPPTLLSLDPATGALGGVDFGHDVVRVVVCDGAYGVRGESALALDVDHRAAEALDAAAVMLRSLLEDAGLAPADLAGLGVALSAPVRRASRAVAAPVILPDWAEVDVAAELGRRLDLPVFVGNDANLGALAEATLGAGRGVEDVVYVMVSTGVGSGVVLGGRLYEGHTGTAGELGHVVVAPDGAMCRCGNRGCLETIAGARALTEALRYSHGPDLGLPDVLALAEQGDVAARRVLADAGRAIGRALGGVCSMLDPGLVVVGGDVAAAGELLLDGIREAVERTVTPSAGHGVRIVGGELGQRAEVLGAVVLAARATPA